MFLKMGIEPLLKTSSERKKAITLESEKFLSSFCEDSIKQSIILNLPFRKEFEFLTRLFKSTPSWTTDYIVLAYMILSQIEFPEILR